MDPEGHPTDPQPASADVVVSGGAQRRCQGFNRLGEPCGNLVHAPAIYCEWHEPDSVEHAALCTPVAPARRVSAPSVLSDSEGSSVEPTSGSARVARNGRSWWRRSLSG